MQVERAAVGALDRLADASRQVNVGRRDDQPSVGVFDISNALSGCSVFSAASSLRTRRRILSLCWRNRRGGLACLQEDRPQCGGMQDKCPHSGRRARCSIASSRGDRRRRIGGSPPALRAFAAPGENGILLRGRSRGSAANMSQIASSAPAEPPIAMMSRLGIEAGLGHMPLIPRNRDVSGKERPKGVPPSVRRSSNRRASIAKRQVRDLARGP
jgi:hypothetical protein